MNIHIIQTLIKLKNASLLGQERFIIKFNKKVYLFLVQLYREGLLLSLQSINIKTKDYIVITIKMSQSLNIFKNLKILSSQSKTFNLQYVDLCRLQIATLFILLSTDKGLLNGVACKQYKIGGKGLILC